MSGLKSKWIFCCAMYRNAQNISFTNSTITYKVNSVDSDLCKRNTKMDIKISQFYAKN